MAVLSSVGTAGDMQPAVAQSGRVLEEHLVEIGVAGNPLEPVACHQFVGHAEVGSLTK